MKCPECCIELGEGLCVEMYQLGWCCSKCNIKIYKTEYETKN